MRIVFTGGGTGGHFYPIIAVAEEINRLVEEKKYVPASLYFLSTTPYDKRALFENGITFKRVYAGKVRRYFSLRNITDTFKTLAGILRALLLMFELYPDVVFSKGGYASFPALFAARILRIPVIIHESDVVPGRVSVWAKKFARRIAISYPEAAQYFPKEKTALTGIPVRKLLQTPITHGAHEFLGLDQGVPTILVLGGSQGSQKINDTVVDILPKLLARYQIVHQTGAKNFEETTGRAKIVLEDNPNASRYKPFSFLGLNALAMGAGVSMLVITRAGSTALVEIAHWGLPSIVIPIPEAVSHDQTKNAYAYVRTGAGTLIEEGNLSDTILLSEIERIASSPDIQAKMKEAAKAFARPDAANLIANEILSIALSHEK